MYKHMYMWQDGSKLRDYRKAKRDILLVGGRIEKTHFSQHPRLPILGLPTPLSKKTKYKVHMCNIHGADIALRFRFAAPALHHKHTLSRFKLRHHCFIK